MKKKVVVIFIIVLVIILGLYFKFFRETECQMTTPNVVGLKIGDAKSLVESRGYILTTKDTILNATENGQVVAQSPPPGTKNCDRILLIVNK